MSAVWVAVMANTVTIFVHALHLRQLGNEIDQLRQYKP